MLLCETIRGLIFFPTLWPGTPKGDVEMVPGMIKHAVLILRLFVTDGTAIIYFSHHFTTDLALFLCVVYGGVEFFLNAKLSRDGERHGVQDGLFTGVWQTLSLQHLLLKLLHLDVSFLGNGGLQLCRVKHLWGHKQLREHVKQDLSAHHY